MSGADDELGALRGGILEHELTLCTSDSDHVESSRHLGAKVGASVPGFGAHIAGSVDTSDANTTSRSTTWTLSVRFAPMETQ